MRKHYFDNGKAIASFLGIIYHTALVFSGASWLISVDKQQTLPLLQIYTDYINLFRMPLFLFIAGYFAAYSVSKYNIKDFTLNKLTRLGIPLITTLLTFNILEKIYIFNFNQGYFSPKEILITLVPWNNNFQLSHLWFLYYVIIFSFSIYLISICKSIFTNSTYINSTYINSTYINSTYINSKRRLRRYIDYIIPLVNVGILGLFGVAFVITGFFHELLSFLTIGANLPYFLLGVITYQNWAFFNKKFLDLSNKRIIMFSLLLIISYVIADRVSEIIPNSNTLLNTLPRYFSLILVLGLLYRYLNKSNSFLKYMSHSSYTVYLIHQPIIVIVSYYYIKYINLSYPLIGYFMVFSLSTILIYAFDYIFIRKNKLGTLLFTGKQTSKNKNHIPKYKISA